MAIIEIANQAENDIVQPVAARRVGLLVHGNIDIDNRLAQLRAQNIQEACVAYVLPKAARRTRRCYALSLGLSSCHSCPCAVFSDENKARAWLSEQLSDVSMH